MWYEQKPRRDKNGKRWNFVIWSDLHGWAERLFFWDDEQEFCGVILFPPGRDVYFKRLKQLMEKLVADSALRKQHRRDLQFPLERYYSEYGAFPEEK